MQMKDASVRDVTKYLINVCSVTFADMNNWRNKIEIRSTFCNLKNILLGYKCDEMNSKHTTISKNHPPSCALREPSDKLLSIARPGHVPL